MVTRDAVDETSWKWKLGRITAHWESKKKPAASAPKKKAAAGNISKPPSSRSSTSIPL